MTMMIRRPSPLREMLSLSDAVDRFFEDPFFRTMWTSRRLDGGQLPLDVQTTPDALVVKAALPGIKPEDVEVTIDGNTLTINAHLDEEREDDEQGYLVREIRRGTFSRSVALSSDLKTDDARAEFENGIVMLTIPRAEQAKPRRIPIAAGASADQAEPKA